jgi:hypothetical protein
MPAADAQAVQEWVLAIGQDVEQAFFQPAVGWPRQRGPLRSEGYPVVQDAGLQDPGLEALTQVVDLFG